jgi:hypothetical protein
MGGLAGLDEGESYVLRFGVRALPGDLGDLGDGRSRDDERVGGLLARHRGTWGRRKPPGE